MAATFKEKIGFLPYSEPIQFYNGGIYPLENFEETAAYVKDKSNRDGFFYPPVIHTVRQSHELVGKELRIKEEPISNSSRPAHLFKMPPSHEIEILRPTLQDDPKKGDGLFLTYLAAFHFGIRLQFHDWWFDNRVPIDIDRDFHASHSATENFIDQAFRTWSGSSKEGKNIITNILFMQSRARSYEWDWEKFIIAYMVFDGCYNYLNKFNGVYSRIHKERFKKVINHFEMKYDQDWVDRFVYLRNELFHETLWEGGQPCGSGTTLSYSATFHLSKLNGRIITAILGHRGEYIHSPWWSRSMFLF